jgi:hypothetical protein
MRLSSGIGKSLVTEESWLLSTPLDGSEVTVPGGRALLFILAILSKTSIASLILPLEQRYLGDSGITLEKIRRMKHGEEDNASNHLHPSIGMIACIQDILCTCHMS